VMSLSFSRAALNSFTVNSRMLVSALTVVVILTTLYNVRLTLNRIVELTLPIGSSAGICLIGEAFQVTRTQGAHLIDLWLDGGKWLQRFRLARREAEDVVHAQDSPHSCSKSKAQADMDISVGLWTVQILRESLDLSMETGLKIEELPTPHFALIDSLEIIASNNAKVATATLESCEKVWVTLCISVDNLPACEDNLVVYDIVTYEPLRIRVVRQTT
jgi:hypothetical protein